MSTLDRYILNIFVRNLFLVLLTLVALYSLIEFLEKVDDFIEHRAALKFYLLYPIYNMPVMIANSLPMATLLATFATIGGLSRTCQLTAMQSSGISFGCIGRPLFLGGLVLSLIVLVGNLWLVPLSSRETNYIRRVEITNSSHEKKSSKNLNFRDGNKIVSINHSFPEKGIILGLTVVEFNDQFLPVKRTQAEKAVHTENGYWQLKNAVIWNFVPETKAVASFEKQDELLLDVERQPSDMLQLWNRPEDLAIDELLQITSKLGAEGYDPKPYQVETQMRVARAAIPLIMVLVGIPFALQRGRNASFSLGIVISLVIFVVYFILYAIFAVFGAISILPPIVAAWSANLLMALIGSWFFLRVQG